MTTRRPALFIAAPASGQGKTAVTAALARLHVRRGRRVRVLKCGPDFLDPMVHAAVTGAPCYNLDPGMCGEADCAAKLAAAADAADLVLVEGVMGLHDGSPSGADIARRFGIPVMVVIDAQAMGQTFGAVAHGLATYRPGLPFSGVLANRVAGAPHAEMLRASLPPGTRWYGALPPVDDAALPERHLGLMQAAEVGDLVARLDRLADHLEATGAAELPPAVEFRHPTIPTLPQALAGCRIAIARDAAFGFIYPANLDTLRELGAELVFFSPLGDDALPACDAVWLPGGYPELHAATLAARRGLWRALATHVAAGRPLLAECGGMMALFEQLVDQDGTTHTMAGLLAGSVVMQPHVAALGLQLADLPEGRLRGHTFHFSTTATPLVPPIRAYTPEGGAGEPIYRNGRMIASYMHFYFPSNPAAAAALFA